ncbi:DUF5801 repeats-in-toxin domain-containing protein [Bradyrhizobium sp. CB1650]|uniref:DUF5801 repeats-in-toxin domain-containing protein n=1 Tax=Bradyrhizobium sp. CB1650 TaxID=3039153 RepID=UPI002435FE17|nr:DUF5801 repeats-in-toxin domain-containing protein [Bradyrhizobium sp. CB1650]WGD49493.1 DUF5801 repeats-in-toxin domain-containing protein [Bradyrhizobium sp. CB1650]
MNAQFQVAQATGSAVPTNSTPVRTFSLAKPLTDQAVVVHLGYDQKVKLDFSAIANEKITLVHVGEKLIILFDNKSTITVDPVFDSRHDGENLLSIELAPGRDVNVQEFASLFPITTDQSVLPAAGDGNGNAQGSGANFTSSAVDPLQAGNPLDLLGQEDLGNFRTGDPQFLTTPLPGPTVIVTGSAELVVDESFIKSNGTNSPGSTTGLPGANVDIQSFQVVFTVNAPAGLQSVTYELKVDNPNTNLIDSLSGQGVVLVQKGTAEVDGVVTVNGQQLVVFTLTVDSTGHITMTDLRGVHENDPTNTNEVVHLGSGLVSLTATAVDVSGNTAIGNFDLGPHITIHDDSPSIDVAQGEGNDEGPQLPFLPALEVDESALPGGAQTPSFPTTAKQDFSGAFTHVDGADGATITYALSVANGGVDTHLVDSLTGHEVFLFNEGGIIVAREGTNATTAAGGAIVFTLEVDSSGQVTMTLERSVHELTPETNVPSDEPIQLSGVPVTLTATITDNDGDSDSASIDISTSIVIHDDSPTIGVVQGEGGDEGPQLPVLPVLEVDESALPSHAQPQSFAATVTKDFSGLFTHADGADGATITYALSVADGGVDTHLVDSLTGHEVFLFNEGGTLVAREGTNAATAAGGAIVFTLEVDSSGHVTMTLDRSVHELTPQANVPSNEPIQLSGVPVTLTATITDNDGDSDSASIDISSTIVIHDDSPTLTLTPGENSVTIDETPGQQVGTNDVTYGGLSAAAQAAFNNVAHKGSDPDVSHDHGAIGYAVNSGLVSASINFGADGADATQSKLFALTLSQSGVDSGLQTTEGREIFLFLENGVIVGRYDSPNDGNTVVNGSDPAAFAIAIDPTTGQVSVAQYVSLNHPTHATDANGFNSYNEPVSLATGSVSIALTVKDADGDTVTKSVDVSGEITFRDDGPKVTVNVDECFSVVLDETPGVQFEDDDTASSSVRHLFDSVVNTGSDPDLSSIEKDHGAIGFAISGHEALDVHAIFGADGPAVHNSVVYSLTLNGVSGSVDSGIQTTDGKEIYLTIENGVIVGRVDTNGDHHVSTSDPAAFAIAIDDDGHVATAEYLSLKHPNPLASDETVQLTHGVVSATVTVTDGDQDQATASADISSNIRFEDDVPQAYDVKPFVVLDDEAQSLFPANFGGSGDVFPSLNTLTGGPNTLFNSGADGTKTVTFAAPSGLKAIYKLDSGLAGQETLDYTTTTSGGHTILTATGHDSHNVVFTLDVAADGSYTFKISEPLVHPTNSTTEEDISVKIGFTVTDGDGDHHTGSLTVKVNDDTPTVDVDQAQKDHHDVTLSPLTLDESIGTSQSDLNADSDDVGGVSAPSFLTSADPTKAIGITRTPTSDKGTSVADLFTTDVDFGADGAKAAPTFSYTFTLKDDHGNAVSNGSSTGVETNLVVTALAGSPLAGLTDAQRTIYLFKEADGSIVGKIGIGGGGNVSDYVALHVVIDQSSGEPRIVVEQYLPIQHGNTGSSDEPAALTFDDRDASLGVTLTVTATDGDGDVASDSKTVTLASHDSSLIKIEDSGPTVTITPTAVTVVHDETPGVQNAGDPNASDDVAGANLPSGVLTSFNAITNKGSDSDVPTKDNGAIGFAVSSASVVSVVATFGTDGPAKTNSTVLSLKIDGGNNTDSGLQTTDGKHILLSLETYNGVSMIVGRVLADGHNSVSTADPAAFAIEIGQDGRISLAQYLSLKNPSPGSSPSDLDEPTTTLQHIQAVVTVTDGDGDHATQVVDISSHIQFQDDGPTLQVGAPAVIGGLDFGNNFDVNNQWGNGSGVATGTTGAWTIANSETGQGGSGAVQLERVGDGYQGMHSSTGGFMVDLDASPHDVKISQVVTGLVNGQTYDLRFEAGAPIPNSAHLEIWFGGVKIGDISPTGQMQEYTIQVVGGSGPNHDNLLEFRETGTPDNQGTYLANVSVGEIVIDETAGIQPDSNEVAANSRFDAIAHQGTDLNMLPQFAEGRGAVVTVSANFGSDGQAASGATAYALQTANSGVTDSGLQTTAGQHIILFNETYGGVSYVVGRYDSNGDHQVTSADDAAFAFTIDASNGKLSLVQYVSLHQPNTASNDEGVFLSTGSLSVTVTVKDGDNDTASKTVDISTEIRFDDDGPTIQASGEAPSLSVDESYLTAATNGVDGSHTGPAGSTTDHISFASAFTSAPGADGATITYALAASGATSTSGVDSGLIDSATGNKVFLFLEGGKVVGREGTDATAAVGGPQVFTLSVDPNSADVILTQLRAVHELTPGDFNEGISLDHLPNLVTLVATITDGDGDTATASIDLGTHVTFHDDGPSISAVNAPVSTETVSYSLQAGNAIYRGADGNDDHDILLTAFNGSTSNVETVNTSQGQSGNIGVGNHAISGNGDGNIHAPDYVRIDFVTHVATTNGQSNAYTATQHDDVTSATVSIAQIQGNQNNTATIFLQIQHTSGDNSSASHDFTDDAIGSITNITVNGTSVFASAHAVYDGTTLIGYVISGVHEGDTIAVTGASAFNRLIVGDYHDFAFPSDSSGQTTTIAGGHEFTLSGVQANVVVPTVFKVIEDETDGVNVAADPNPANDVDPSLVAPPSQLAAAIAANSLIAIGFAESPDTVSGFFTSNSGADAPATVSYALSTSTANGHFTGQDSGLFATAGHAAIHLYTDSSDPSIVWGVANGDLSSGTKVFALTFDSSGHLWVAQFQAVSNPIAGSDAAAFDDAVSIQPGTLFVTGTITDADSDSASVVSPVPVKVTFQDDGPHAVLSASTIVTIDETAGQDAGTDDVANIAAVSGLFAAIPGLPHEIAQGAAPVVSIAGASFGTDGPGAVQFALSLTVINGADSGLDATDGRSVFLYQEGNLIVGREGTAGNSANPNGAVVFAIALDASTGVLTVAEYSALHHNNPLDPNEAGAPLTLSNGLIKATVTITDGDGDSSTASVNIGSQIKFLDDGPSVAGNANLITNGSFEDGHPDLGNGQWSIYHTLPAWTSADIGQPGSDDDVPFEVQTGGVGGVPAQDGNALIELDSDLGSGNLSGADNFNHSGHTNATIQQVVAGTEAGQTYELTFWYAPRPNEGDANSGSLNVLWNGNVVKSIDSTGMTPGVWQQITVFVEGTGPNNVLAFQGAGQENSLGALIDNVSLVAAIVVDEDGLPTGHHDSSPGDIVVPNTDGDNNEATASGLLDIKWGADNADQGADGSTGSFGTLVQDHPGGIGNRSVTFDANNPLASFGGTIGGNLTSHGEAITLSLNGDGTVLTGKTASGRSVFEVSLSDDGSGKFRFVLLDRLDHAIDSNENNINLSFNYKATDSDGDAVTGKFSVVVNDDVPVLTGQSVAGTVNEGDIPASVVNYTETVVNLAPLVEVGPDQPGTWTLTSFASQNVGTLTYNGVQITMASDGHTITGSAGGTTVFTVTLSADGHATFDLFTPIDGNQTAQIDFSNFVTVTDYDGDSVKLGAGEFLINVKSPVSASGSASLTVDESALDLTQADNDLLPGLTTGSNPDGKTETAQSTAVTFTGSDDVTGVAFGSTAGITVTGATGTFAWVLNNTTHQLEGHIGTAGGPLAIVLSIGGTTTGAAGTNVSPTITVTLTDNFPHASGSGDVTVSGITLVATDAGGHHASGNVSVTITDDVPQAVSDLVSDQSGVSLTTTSATGVLHNDSSGADVPAIVVGVGAGNLPGDQGANVDQQVTGSLGKLTLHGDGSYTYVANPNVSGNDVFTYTIKDSDGDLSTTTLTITVTDGRPLASAATDQVDEAGLPDGSNPGVGATTATGHHLTFSDPQNDTVTVSQVNATTVSANGTVVHGTYGDLTINLDGSYSYTLLTNDPNHTSQGTGIDGEHETFTYTVTDSHGNTQSSTLTIDIVDDVPTIGAIVTAPVAESTSTSFANTFVPASTSGSLAITWGADNANPDVGPHDRSVAFDSSLNGVQAGLTSNGDAITYTLSNDNTLLTATATHASITRTIFTVSIDDLANGNYSFNLLDNIDHAAPASGADTNDKALSFGFTATDSDGDTTNSTLTIHVTDDIPVVTGAAQSGDVTEHGLPQVQTTFGKLNIDWNADDRGTSHLEFARDGSNDLIVPTGLTSGGVALDYAVRLAANGVDQELVAFKTGETVDQPVFIVALNGLVNPSFAFQLDQPLDHTGGNGTSLPLTFTVKAIDGDGDSVTQTFTVNVADDTPQAVDDGLLATHAENVSGLNIGTVGGLLANDHFGADGQAVVNPITIGAGDHGGTVTIDGTGNLIYSNTTQNVTNGHTVNDTFIYTIQDGDGDTSTATFTVTLTDTGVSNVATSANLVADEDDLPTGNHDAALGDVASVLTGQVTYVLGADDIGSVTLSTAGDTTTLQTLSGAAVDTVWAGGELIGYVHGTDSSAAANQVFTIAISGVTDSGATYTMTLLQPVKHTVSGTEDNTLPFTVDVHVTDADGSPGSTSFTVVVNDDTPVAANDGPYGVIEDAASNVSGNVLSNDQSGADAPASFVAWGGAADAAAVSALNTYGTLLQNNDGTWSYTLDNSRAATQALTSSDHLSFTLHYTMQDADGDTSPATLTINVTGTNDSATVTTVQLEGPDVTVYEAGLSPNGSAAATDAETTTGSFAISATDGIKEIVVGGITFTLAQIQAFGTTHGTVNTGEGILTLTGYTGTGSSGTVSFSYTLSATIDNDSATPTSPDSVDGTGFNDHVALAVHGIGGTSASDDLVVRIVDDTPTAHDDTYGPTISGPTVISALFNNDVFGADGVDTDNSPVAGQVTVTNGAHGTVTYNNDNTFTYTPTGVYVGDDTFTYTIKDNDGDTSTATVTVHVQTNTTPTGGGSVSLTVNEAALDLVQDASPLPADLHAGVVTGTSPSSRAETAQATTGITFNATGEAITVAFGDPAVSGSGWVAPTVNGLAAGYSLSWSVVGGQLVGTLFQGATNLGAAIYLGLTNTSAAANTSVTPIVTVTLVDQLQNALSPTDVTITGLHVVATDTSGDQVFGIVNVTVKDDVPTAFTPETIYVEDVSHSTLTGQINFAASAGADGVGDVKFNVTEGAAVLDTNGNKVFLNGEQLFYHIVDSHTIQGKSSVANGSDVAFTETLHPGSDTWDFVLNGTLFNGAQFTSSSFTNPGGSNNPVIALHSGDTSHHDLLATANLSDWGNTVNTNNAQFGVDGGNSIGWGETLRFDFVTNASTNGTVLGTSYTDHYDIQSFTAAIDHGGGSNSIFTVRAVNADNDQSFVGDLSGESTVTGITVTVVNNSGGTAPIVTYNGDGTVTLSNMDNGDTFTITAGSHTFDAVEIAGGFGTNTFKVSSPLFTTGNSATPFDISSPVTATDGDGDSTSGSVTVHLSPDASTTQGTSGADSLTTNATITTLLGEDGNDTLTGINQVDTLSGGRGDDTLIGNGGADNLTGGSGNDTFKYNATSDSTVAAHDVISDFTNSDVIDFTAISGITNDAVYSSTTPTSVAAHSIVYFQSGADTHVYANASGATENLPNADMMLVLTGVNASTLNANAIHQ